MKIKISLELSPYERIDNTKVKYLIKKYKSIAAKNGLFFLEQRKPIPGFSRIWEFVFVGNLNENNTTDKTKTEE